MVVKIILEITSVNFFSEFNIKDDLELFNYASSYNELYPRKSE